MHYPVVASNSMLGTACLWWCRGEMLGSPSACGVNLGQASLEYAGVVRPGSCSQAVQPLAVTISNARKDSWKKDTLRLPRVLTPGAGALLRFLRGPRSKEEVWKGLDAAGSVKHGSRDIAEALLELRRCKEWELLIQVYEWMILRSGSFKPDVRTYNLVMEAYAKAGQPEKAAALFHSMRQGVQAVVCLCQTHSPVNSSAGAPTHLPDGKDGWGRGLEPSSGEGEGFVPAPQATGQLVLDGVCIPNEASWTIVISAYADAGRLEEARRTYEEMRAQGYRPSLLTYNQMLHVFGQLQEVRAVEALFSEMAADRRTAPTLNSYNLLIAAYGLAGMPKAAEAAFERLYTAELLPNEITIAALLAAYATAEMPGEAERALAMLVRMGHSPEKQLFDLLVAANCGDAPGALRWFEEMQARGRTPDSLSYLNLLGTLAHGGQWQDAEKIYERIPRPSVCGWEEALRLKVLQAYAKGGAPEELQASVSSMRAAGAAIAEEQVFDLLVLAHGMAGQLENVFRLLEGSQAEGAPLRLSSLNAALHGLGKLGLTERAEELFSSLEQATGVPPDCHSYAALMSAYAARKNVRKCLGLLRRMCAVGVAPDSGVRRALLGACRSDAQVAEVWAALEAAKRAT